MELPTRPGQMFSVNLVSLNGGMNTMPASSVVLPVVKVHFPCFMHHLTLPASGSPHELLDTNVKKKKKNTQQCGIKGK